MGIDVIGGGHHAVKRWRQRAINDAADPYFAVEKMLYAIRIYQLAE